MKIGRNDPCHCSSGKKYKKCCLTNNAISQEFVWKKVHKSRNELILVIMKFAIETYGEDSIDEAWAEFNCWDDNTPGFDPESYQNQIFMPWVFYDWTPDPLDTTVSDEKYHNIPIGQALLDINFEKLTSLQKKYVEQCLESPFSFFEVVESKKGKGYQLIDLFTLEEYNVVEKMGSESTQKGDMLFGKLVTIEGLTTLEACSPFAIPPSMKLAILELRNHIKTNYPIILNSILKKYDFELLNLYHQYHDAILNPKPPRICNTDGDDMIPQKLIYQVQSLEDTFNKLHYLDILSSKKELLDSAIRDDDGSIRELRWSWYKKGNKKHKTWDNTVLGHIKLTKDRMTIDINSSERAKKIKTIIEQSLDNLVVYKKSIIEDLSSMLSSESSSSLETSAQENNLINHPEVQEKIKEMMVSHWSSWVNEEIPALGGKTPKQASKSKDGQELLRGLITDFEREANQNPQTGVNLETFEKIRKELGIPKAI